MVESLNSLPCIEPTIALIYETFDGITRDGGVSWIESVVIDDRGSPAEQAAARSKDVDATWQELVNDATWNHERGTGGFSFLDAIGFRYYLAPAMVRQLRDVYSSDVLSFFLTLDDDRFREWSLDRWSALQKREIQCVCDFLKCMMAVGQAAAVHEWEIREWEQAYNSHWITLDGNPIARR